MRTLATASILVAALAFGGKSLTERDGVHAPAAPGPGGPTSIEIFNMPQPPATFCLTDPYACDLAREAI